MKLQTIGHACLVLRDDDNKPFFITDPWLLGSTYWRSWWLQNYPTKAELDELSDVKYCYLTHEHPDHYNLPSIRKLGNKPLYLSPTLPQENIATFLTDMNLKTQVLDQMEWYQIHEKAKILSIPLFSDDSCLLIDTPKVFIINFNDAKPFGHQLKQLKSYIDKYAVGKKVLVLNSYSPASIVNSVRKDGKLVTVKEKKDYVTYLTGVMNALEADYFLPFASQVIFYRPDASWANEYKVTLEDMQQHWTSKTTLLAPYTTLNLEDFSHTSISPANYNHDAEPINEKIKQRLELELTADFTEEDEQRLEKKMNGSRLMLAALFPRGIGFEVDKQAFHYSTIKGKVTKGLKNTNSFSIKLPTQALKEAILYGHFADLGVTMFTIVILNQTTNPKLIYLFFIIINLHDYSHTQSIKNFMKWSWNSLTIQKWAIPDMQTKYLSLQ